MINGLLVRHALWLLDGEDLNAVENIYFSGKINKLRGQNWKPKV